MFFNHKFAPLYLVAAAVAIAVISILFQGFSFPYNNNAFHVPAVLNYAGSPEGPHDTFHRSLSRFVSGFWVIVSWIADEQNIAQVFLAFHVATRTGCTLTILLMLRHFGAAYPSACVVTLLIFMAPVMLRASPVSGSDMLPNYLTQSGVIVPFILGAWFLAWQGRWLWSSAMLGAGFNINAYLAIWNGCALFAARFLRYLRTPRALLATIGPSAAIFVILAAPNALWIASVLQEPAPRIDFREFLRNYWAGHTFVDASVYRGVPFVAFLAIGYRYLRNAHSFLGPPAGAQILSTYSAILTILVFAAGLPYVVGSQTVLNTYPLRIDSFAMALVAITAAISFNQHLLNGDRGAGHDLAFLLGVLLGDVLIMALALCANQRRSESESSFSRCWTIEFGLLLLTAASVLAPGVPPGLLELVKPPDFVFAGVTVVAIAVAWRTTPGHETLLLVATASIVADLIPLASLPPRWVFAPLLLAAVLAVARVRGACAVGAVALCIVSHWLWRHAQGPQIYVAAAFGLIALTASSVLRPSSFKTWLPHRAAFLCLVALTSACLAVALVRGSLNDFTAAQRDLLRAQHWARNHTSPDTMFVAGRRTIQFSTLSRRPVWVDWKMGAAVMWMPSYYDEWRDRYLELRHCSDASCLVDIARRNNISWLVLQSSSAASLSASTDFCIAYRNPTYVIATLDQSKCAT